MSDHFGPQALPGETSEAVMSAPQAADCLMSMGDTSENVAAQFNITRDAQDQFAVESHQKAARAIEKGHFCAEIVPVETKSAEGSTVVVKEDDGVRSSTTPASLGKLRPSFKEDGTSTAGNSSQITDGAAAVH